MVADPPTALFESHREYKSCVRQAGRAEIVEMAIGAIGAIARRTGISRGVSTSQVRDSADHQKEMDDLPDVPSAGRGAGFFRDFDVALRSAGVRVLLDLALTCIRQGADPTRLTAELTATVDAMTEVGR